MEQVPVVHRLHDVIPWFERLWRDLKAYIVPQALNPLLYTP
jgi:hypothetical protein